VALFNYASKEITIKIVYYGPGLSGKTTNLQYLHSAFEPSKRGKLISLATEADRTLFFDFLPVELGRINDFSIRFQLYTVPGQVRYNATRKLVLKGADAVVFVADSQNEMRAQNLDSIANMRENLLANNINPDEIPIMLQFNKRDLANIASVEELNRELNPEGRYEYAEAVAINGTGVQETFQRIHRLVLRGIAEKHKIKIEKADDGSETSFGTSAEHEAERIAVGIPSSSVKSSLAVESMEPARNTLRTDARSQSILAEEMPPRGHAVASEAHRMSKETLELIATNVRDLSHTLRELKTIVQNLQTEIKESRREQKELHTRLKEISIAFDNIKTKKRWFTFL